MEVNNLLEFYREQYALELETKREITARAQLLLAFLVAVGGLLVYMAKNLTVGVSWPVITTAIFLLISTLTLAGAAILVIKSFWGNEYSYIPSLGDFEKRRQFHINSGDSDTGVEGITNEIFRELAECCDENSTVNNKRNSKLNAGIRFVLGGCVPLVMGAAVFIGADLDEASSRKPINVNVVDSCLGAER
ncbi:hypothetical protein [Alteromonas ponticola]|uniref:Pycsar effector protein domain-containing protein n=1 Tax=Alteromonas ponticola TaxID=2720613 RepID=A0ABX1R683_9ALTE|nr:hypothetical protein [Alteromonas ponticola]NMH60996.1 hypothetical protein [Alteromonas ponticola]